MTNPPFLALPGTIRLGEKDRKLLSNVSEIRETANGAALDVRAAFPRAGWGGEDGLSVTKEFLDVLGAVLRPGSKTVVYSQFAGDQHGPAVIRQYVEQIGGREFAFEAVKPTGGTVRKAVCTSKESAGTVARLLTAALMEKQEPGRVRLEVRSGGPEHVLMGNLADAIDASYRRAGITHFHDGFVTFTRGTGEPRRVES